MSATDLAPNPLLPRHDSRLGLGAALALLAHGGLVAALAVGLNWRLPVPDSVMSAELWSAVPQPAAPTPTPVPTLAPAPATVPIPAPAPAPSPPAPSVAQREAEIALEKAANERKRAQEAEEAQKKRRQLDEQGLAEQKAVKLKQAQQAREEKARADEQKADKLKADKARELKRQQELAAQREAAKAVVEADREAKLQEEALALAMQREANLKRMMGQASATGAPQATGSAAHDSAPSAAYAGRIKARIKPNIVLLSEVSGNPVAEIEVRSAPDGNIVGRRIVKPSGNAAWDETVLRAIDRTGSLPRDTDGRMPPTLILVFPRQE